MSGRHHLRAKVPGGVEQIAKLDRLIAGNARHRRLAGDIALGKAVDHLFLEAAFVIEHVMRDAERFGHLPRIMDVTAGTTGTLAMRCLAVIIKLQRDADDVIALRRQQGGGDGRIHAARHRDHDAGVLRTAVQSQ